MHFYVVDDLRSATESLSSSRHVAIACDAVLAEGNDRNDLITNALAAAYGYGLREG
jgi:hypothetical protein